MIIRKVRGQNKLKPILLSRTEHDMLLRLGLKVEDFVKDYVKTVAKKRRWKWYFAQKTEKGKLKA